MFFSLNISMDSLVWFSRECIRSMTTIARSHRDEPLDLRFAKDSCPGVSMIKSPGSSTFISKTFLSSLATSSSSFSLGKKEAPIYYVIPPSSPSWTFVRLIWSKILVFPVSTCPMIQIIGHLSYESEWKISLSNYFSLVSSKWP